MDRVIISNANILQPGGVIRGSVVSEGGVVTAVVDRELSEGFDAHGALVAPGVIDLHNDGLEGEIDPRPGVGLPFTVAMNTFDRRAAASGITMAFHAITFADLEKNDRSVERGAARARSIRALEPEDTIAEHRVLFRADSWQPGGLDSLFACASEWDIRLVTLNDHTPGQGQYRDLAIYRRAIQKWLNHESAEETERHLREKMRFAAEHPDIPAETFSRVAAAVGPLGLVLGSHDDDAPERCRFMQGIGATVAEFPVTMEAALEARRLGMTIVAGAPNVVRGGSHSGNVSALELVATGLCDVLVADYHAPSLLLAAQELVERGVVTLQQAFALISTNPARAIGRHDLGTVETGKGATFTLVRMARGRPWQAAGIVRNGRVRAWFEELQPSRALQTA